VSKTCHFNHLNVVGLESCNADAIADAVTTELQSKWLDLTKLVAIGTDNASAMVGVNDGVHQKLKK